MVWDGSEAGDRQVQWLVQDHLGSTRIVVDRSGSLGGVRRHDFAPFGEELFAGVGIRSASIGYSDDSVREKFTGYEHDGETDLDFAQARYYSAKQGRFTSPDTLLSSADTFDPQSWNRYIYVGNRPTVVTDPDGLKWYYNQGKRIYQWFQPWENPGEGWVVVATGHIYDSIYGEVILLPNGDWDYVKNRLPKQRESVFRDNELSPYFLGLFGAYLTAYGAAAAAEGTFAGFLRQLLIGELTGQAVDGMVDVAPETHQPASAPEPERLKLGELTPTEEVSSKSKLKKLIPDIAENGIKEPIKYVEHGGVKYIVDGHHRYAAAWHLKIREVPAQRVSLPYLGYKSAHDLTTIPLSRFLRVLRYIK